MTEIAKKRVLTVAKNCNTVHIHKKVDIYRKMSNTEIFFFAMITLQIA